MDEWNYSLNNNLRIEDFVANSHQKVWWKCSKGHEWQAMIKDRNRGNGCPHCTKEKRRNNPLSSGRSRKS